MFIKHPFGPLFDGNSRILILGSFPSVKSREARFFYGHRQNRFWYVMAALLKYKPVKQDMIGPGSERYASQNINLSTHTEQEWKTDIAQAYCTAVNTPRLGGSPAGMIHGQEGGIGIAGVQDFYVPQTVEEKKDMLLSHGIALWDTIASCDIKGSSDSSISSVMPNDLSIILDNAAISTIGLNGTKSYELFMKYTAPGLRLKYGEQTPAFRKLPSTSPANAAWSKERLIGEWDRQLFK